MSNKLVVGRLSSLDSVRGIAALSVVLVHLFYVYLRSPDSDYANFELLIKILFMSPLGILINGSPAVPIFFVLSGFVLRLMLERGMGYGEYLVRRGTRLYVPYIASIAVAVALISVLGSEKNPQLSDWTNEFLGVKVTFEAVLDHILFIGVFDTIPYNFPIWTLVQEMRISIFFPVLLFLILRYGWKRNVAWALVAAIAAVFLGYYIKVATPYPLWQSVTDTVFWSFFLVVGASLAVHREAATAWYRGLSKRSLAVLWVVAVADYLFPVHIPILTNVYIGSFWALASLPAVAFFIVAAFSSPTVEKFLGWGPFRFLGKISYSLYLCHAIILVTALNLFFGKVPLWMISSGVLVASFVVGTLAFHWIERPSIKLGAMLGSRLAARRAAAAVATTRTA
ncbi:MAG: acyltransferase family protein [Panacagrimonas sp.]